MFQSVKNFSKIGLMAIVFAISPFLFQNGWADYANPTVGDVADAAYWLDRGGLYSTYGNYAAAVKAYKKAMALDQHSSAAYFNLSLAYCEMGAYADALINVKQALAGEPQNGKYLYGMAWILLKAGRAAEAQPQFQMAADLGDQDARAYLQHH